MTSRKLDDLFRWLGMAMGALIACFLLIPIIVTIVMAFDARPYLGSLPPPALSFRWFEKFFSDDYFLRGLARASSSRSSRWPFRSASVWRPP